MIGIVACVIVLTLSAVLILIRVVRGPSMLDRMVGLDILTTVIIAAVGLEAAWNRHTSTIVILVVLSLVGFVGSTTVARFAAVEPRDEAKLQARYYGRQRNPRRGVRVVYRAARRRLSQMPDNKPGSEPADNPGGES